MGRLFFYNMVVYLFVYHQIDQFMLTSSLVTILTLTKIIAMKESPVPCVNEPTTQPEPTIQETLGKKIKKNSDHNEPSEVALTPTLPLVIYANQLNQETSDITSEPTSTNQTQLAFPMKNDTISIIGNKTSDAIVLGRGKKFLSVYKKQLNMLSFCDHLLRRFYYYHHNQYQLMLLLTKNCNKSYTFNKGHKR